MAAGLGLVIFFHELGHFLVAKWCGVYVERFSIGFGQPILARTYGETEYALGWLPFGGYVKMLGQDDMDPGQMTDDVVSEDPRSYTAKNVLQRMAIISAGVIMNVITGLGFFALAFSGGIQQTDRSVGHVVVGMPAWEHGLQTGDVITSMNGRPVTGFDDILRRTTLSRGALKVEGIHPDGETFSATIQPEKTGISRKIGVGFPSDVEVMVSPKPEEFPAILPGTAAARSEIQPGDRIVAVNEAPIADYAGLMSEMNRTKQSPVTLTVLREDESNYAKMSEARINLAAEKFQGFGLTLGMGKVTSLQGDSPAEQAGFQVGDRIAQVGLRSDEEGAEPQMFDVENDLDPIRLTEFFSKHVGAEVLVTVSREVKGGEPDTLQLKVTPRARDPWSEPPLTEGSPLSIPSIGLAYQLVPTVFAVDAESDAAQQEIKPRDTITKIEFKKSLAGEPDGLEDKAVSIDIGEDNWPYAFWILQAEARTRTVELTIKPAEAEAERTVTLIPQEQDDWYLPATVGFRMKALRITRQADDFSAAVAMGAHYTLNSIEDIYLTLRGLFTQDISYKGLSGPIGIAQTAYSFAELGLPHFVLFLGLISINLAVINFLPIPVLDGGHMVFLLWEGLTRRKPNEKVVATATYCGLLFVFSLMLVVIYLDIFVPKH